MDRISAIRNVEDALRAFESGEADLADTERRVAAVLRTYATEFDGDDEVFRATGEEPVDGRIVVAPSAPAARERVLALSGIDPSQDRERDAASDPNNSDDLTGSENDAVPEFEVERV
ncbi:hypothetical protein U4E84_16430 [Halorubrum sp. AD140]|uniref:DUF7854 family protein n=1 Tax=Halorubrum sp. AD140 TaxID=3050073 RepID=UPI002ACD1104|nr:hypothetical protein [Halorubrum sp. AD140]MDZ5812928.1 hypothetical protein [Halorubrum sp. AD140]